MNAMDGTADASLPNAFSVSTGDVIEASIGTFLRRGINTPWWSFTPEHATYVAQPAPVIGTSLEACARALCVGRDERPPAVRQRLSARPVS